MHYRSFHLSTQLKRSGGNGDEARISAHHMWQHHQDPKCASRCCPTASDSESVAPFNGVITFGVSVRTVHMCLCAGAVRDDAHDSLNHVVAISPRLAQRCRVRRARLVQFIYEPQGARNFLPVIMLGPMICTRCNGEWEHEVHYVHRRSTQWWRVSSEFRGCLAESQGAALRHIVN